MTVSDSTFTGNTAAVDGGAIDNGDNGGNGGASGTPNTVSGSTFTDNSADGGTATQGMARPSTTVTSAVTAT